MLLELKNVYKEFILDKDNKFTALKNINLKFDSSGLVCIKGASGSGKSTLLSLISLLDKPTSGQILFNGENILKYKEKNINFYRNHDIGILFQSYNLIEDMTVIYNIMLPSLIGGQSYKSAEKDALELLQKINFPEEFYNKKVSLLSGGEKQRVSLLRSLINAPYILLCDEPTGALDSENSKMVMDILKKVGHRRLVLLVSHNEELLDEYADRIITIKDGEIVDDKIIKNENNGTPVQEHKICKKGKISSKFTNKNLLKRLKRNLFSLFAISISLTFLFLVVGFTYNADNSLKEASYRQFDLGVSTISKENKNQISGSSLSISQVSRISENEMNKIKNNNNDFIYLENLSYFVPNNLNVSYKNELIESLTYNPIYSFSKPYINDTLLLYGKFPISDSLNEVVINQLAYQNLKDTLKSEPLNKVINVSYDIETSFYTESGNKIKDNITYNKNIKIVGVVQELSFLLTPKIYYPYLALYDYFSSYNLNNLSSYFGNDYSVVDRVRDVSDNDPLSSYSHFCFQKNVKNFDEIEKINNSLKEPYAFNNSSYTKYVALRDFSSAISLGLTIFLVIAIIGSVLILGIINYSSYIEDLKDSAILTSLGCNKDEITNIFINESLTIGFISFLFSIILSLASSKLINLIVGSVTDFKNLIYIPFLEFNNIKLIIPLVEFLAIVLVSILTTYIPILFSKKIPLRKELETND